MTWIILEGLDRTFKSSVAELYKKQGYEVIHFSAPDKKYTTKGYTGPNYLDDTIELFVKLSGKNVVFDRTPHYGEQIWPQVYNRQALISDEDIEILKEIEDQNDTQRILMVDHNKMAHWQRCVENKEPLSRVQFEQARELFNLMADKYGFSVKTKDDYVLSSSQVKEINVDIKASGLSSQPSAASQIGDSTTNLISEVKPMSNESRFVPLSSIQILTPEQNRLAEANAINDVLLKPIIKLKGEHYQNIEDKIRTFLNKELAVLLGTTKSQVQNPLSDEEILFIRTLLNNAKRK
jgi:hypothetical protein